MASTLKKAKIKLSVDPLLWSNGDLFNGFLVLLLGLPTDSILIDKCGYTTEQDKEFVQCPEHITHKIIDGKLDSLYIYRNDKLIPPNTRWFAYYYDLSNHLIAPTMGTAAAVNVNSSEFTLTPPTLTVPTAPTSVASILGYGDFK